MVADSAAPRSASRAADSSSAHVGQRLAREQLARGANLRLDLGQGALRFRARVGERRLALAPRAQTLFLRLATRGTGTLLGLGRARQRLLGGQLRLADRDQRLLELGLRLIEA